MKFSNYTQTHKNFSYMIVESVRPMVFAGLPGNASRVTNEPHPACFPAGQEIGFLTGTDSGMKKKLYFCSCGYINYCIKTNQVVKIKRYAGV
jgi:hypothetical protein